MTREEFVSIPQAEKRIRTLKRSISALRSLATSLSAPIGGDRVQATGSNDRTGRLVAEIADAETEMEREIQRLTVLRIEAIRMIRTLQEPDQSVMFLRYIAGKTWESVAEQAEYEIRYTYKIGKRGLNTLFPKLDIKRQ